MALGKLLDLRVRPELLPRIVDFLSNRRQCVRRGQMTSDYTGTTGRVPQGTEVGPVAFSGDGELRSLDSPLIIIIIIIVIIIIYL